MEEIGLGLETPWDARDAVSGKRSGEQGSGGRREGEGTQGVEQRGRKTNSEGIE